MKLYFDLDSCTLVHGLNYLSPISSLELKRGEGTRIELVLIRDGSLYTGGANAEISFIVKPTADSTRGFARVAYDPLTTLALARQWVYEVEREVWSARINFCTEALNEALSILTEPQLDHVDCWCEIAYRASPGEHWSERSCTLPFRLHNNVYRGVETSPPNAPNLENLGTELLVPLHYRVTAQQQITATAYTDVTALAAPVLAGVTYQFSALVIYYAASTTGARFAFMAGARQIFGYTARWPVSTNVAAVGHRFNYNVPTQADGSSTSMNGENIATLEGVIKPLEDSTLQLRAACKVDNNGFTIWPGSTLTITPVA